MALSSRLFLVGPMGAGKSTVGRRLATALGLDFVDSDEEIARRAGADIPWIFDVEGEAGFRDREAAVIEELTQRSGLVVATGGGAVMREGNRKLMAARGTVVYLYAAVEEQVRRTRKDASRPLLKGVDRARVLADLMAIRDPLYREIADLVVDAGGGSVARLAAMIQEQLEDQ